MAFFSNKDVFLFVELYNRQFLTRGIIAAALVISSISLSSLKTAHFSWKWFLTCVVSAAALVIVLSLLLVAQNCALLLNVDLDTRHYRRCPCHCPLPLPHQYHCRCLKLHTSPDKRHTVDPLEIIVAVFLFFAAMNTVILPTPSLFCRLFLVVICSVFLFCLFDWFCLFGWLFVPLFDWLKCAFGVWWLAWNDYTSYPTTAATDVEFFHCTWPFYVDFVPSLCIEAKLLARIRHYSKFLNLLVVFEYIIVGQFFMILKIIIK